MAAGAVALIGTGLIMFGASDDCGILGIFGSCQEKAKTNAKNIEKLGKNAIVIGDNIQQLGNETDEKFFRVPKVLALHHEIQNQIIKTQDENWQKIEKKFQVLQGNIHNMRNGDQILYRRQQVNFNFDTKSSLLSLIYSNVKVYRAALFEFQMKIMNVIPSLLSKYIPMSLLPNESLAQFSKVDDDSQEIRIAELHWPCQKKNFWHIVNHAYYWTFWLWIRVFWWQWQSHLHHDKQHSQCSKQ